jgi:anti-sigma regulatory factor (Ser/Thr protein kinase)
MAAIEMRTFRHEALLYAGEAEFVDRVAAFVRGGVEAAEPVFVVVAPHKIELLRAVLGADADRVRFASMDDVGRNPACIIDAWDRYVREFPPGTPMRGVGEPLTPGRASAERDECHIHEALLNVALADAPIWLVCPYDVEALPADDVEIAARTHPYVTRDQKALAPAPPLDVDEAFSAPLAEPGAVAVDVTFDLAHLRRARTALRGFAESLGFGDRRAHEVALAMSEVATNSLLHGGGEGRVRAWRNDGHLVCEIRDNGQIMEPLVGRVRPVPGQPSGYGLWMVNQLCDLMQIRTGSVGTTVRLHIAPDANPPDATP